MTSEPSSRALRDAAAVESLSPGLYGVVLSEFYTVMGHPNGGYLQCVLGNAALAAASAEGAQHLHVAAITTNYIGSPSCGPAEVRTTVRKVGRGVSFVHVELAQDGQVTSESLVTLGNLHEESDVRYIDTQAPIIAALEDCRQSTGGDEINIMRVVDQRLDPACTTWVDGVLSERGEVMAWLRLNDGEENWGPWSLLFASDAMPPATFPLGSSGWVPTLQLSTYVRRVPRGEWLRVRQWCVTIADNLVDERCELFDEAGELVASASQLAMVRFPTNG